MILRMYAMRDRLTGYMAPTVEQNDAVAIRNFRHALVTTNSILRSSPADFELCFISEYDSETGIVYPVQVTPIISGASISKEVESDAV